jgi:hypothetical protein
MTDTSAIYFIKSFRARHISILFSDVSIILGITSIAMERNLLE